MRGRGAAPTAGRGQGCAPLCPDARGRRPAGPPTKTASEAASLACVEWEAPDQGPSDTTAHVRSL